MYVPISSTSRGFIILLTMASTRPYGCRRACAASTPKGASPRLMRLSSPSSALECASTYFRIFSSRNLFQLGSILNILNCGSSKISLLQFPLGHGGFPDHRIGIPNGQYLSLCPAYPRHHHHKVPLFLPSWPTGYTTARGRHSSVFTPGDFLQLPSTLPYQLEACPFGWVPFQMRS